VKKPWVKIVLAIVAVLIIAILLIPLFVNANTFRPTLEAQLSNALGRPVTLGNLSLSLFSGSLVASNISIADDPAFSSEPFFQAKSLHIGVEVSPLIFQRQVIVRSFAADSPSIHLIHAANGTWNFSSLGRTAASHTQNQQQESAFPNLTVGEIKIENGSASVASQPPSGQPFVYSDLNLSAQQFSFSKNFPFQISASLPAGGSLTLDGTAGPVNQQDASNTPLSAKVNLKHFDPVAAGVVPPDQGIAMVADIAAQLTSDGQTLTSNGTVQADHLKLVKDGAATPSPVNVSYTIHHNLQARTGQIDALKLTTGGVAVQANGSYQMTGPQTTVQLHLSAPRLPINQVQSLLPVAGIRLPSGSKLQGGTLTAQLNISGPVNALTISGPVEVNNTVLAGFDLGSKIMPGGKSAGGTPIQTLSANVTSSPSGTRIEKLYVSVPTVGTASGGGTVSPGGGLNFNVVAKLGGNLGASGGLGAVTGTAGKFVNTAVPKGVPVTITGTTSNPVIHADLASVVKQSAGSILQQFGNGGKQVNPGGLLNKIPH
jgi:AsmA protein